jgi:hypothetical protein
MVVFSAEEFHGMDIDRVDVGATGRFLYMMMFVYVRINPWDVQDTMKYTVGEIKE